MKNLFRFSRWGFDYKHMSDIICVKAGATTNLIFANLFAKIKLIVGGRVSKSFFSILIDIHRQLQAIQKSQGDKGLIMYLKAAQVALQQAASGYKVRDMRPLGARISRTKGSLLPRIIQSSHRSIILNNKPGKYFLLKFYLTLFYSYRVIVVPQYKVNLDTILKDGVEDPLQFIPSRYYKLFLRCFIGRKWTMLYNPLTFLQSYQKLFTILKSSPNNISDSDGNLWSTHPLVMFRSLAALVKSDFVDQFRSLAQAYHPLLLNFVDNYMQSGTLMSMSKPRLSIGKLSFKEEAAGKLRVFAIVDNFTQWLLYPLHKLIFKLLRSIPMDGTFNQLKPIYRLLRLEAKEFYSLDLSAATDRLPIVIQERLLNVWFSAVPDFGTNWAQILVNRSYRFSSDPKYDNSKHGLSGFVKYSVGQPMGALSSWAMLALTHHFLVQVSAWRIGFVSPGIMYTNYALLGDDLVICDKQVAKSYLKLMSDIGVAINLNKSILSPTGKGLEFAKRTFIDGMDVSPISLRDLSLSLRPGAASHWVAFAKAHNLNFTRQASILGFGHKAVKDSFRKLNHALKVVYLANIAKIDMTTEVLNLRSKVPVDLNVNVPAFKAQVLQPILDDLDNGFKSSGDDGWDSDYGSAVFEISDEDRFDALYYNVPYVITDWVDSHSSKFEFVQDKHTEISGLTPEVVKSEIIAQMKKLQWALTKDEAPHIIRQLRRTLNGFDLNALKTLDECLQCYLIVTRMKAVQSIAVHKLADKVAVIPSMKLPYQAKLFRGWSRTVHKAIKISNRSN
jgi:hypothetical protein